MEGHEKVVVPSPIESAESPRVSGSCCCCGWKEVPPVEAAESSCPVAQLVETDDKPSELPLGVEMLRGAPPVAFAAPSSEEGVSLLVVEKKEEEEEEEDVVSFARSSEGGAELMMMLLLLLLLLGALASTLELPARVCGSPRTV